MLKLSVFERSDDAEKIGLMLIISSIPTDAELRPANSSHYPTSSGDEKKHGRRGKSASF
jgi:hypothetical protein